MKSKKIKKGDFGYLGKNKIKQLTITLFLLLMVLLIYFTGYIKYHNTKNIYTVLACVSAIPCAKFAVAYIVLFPYKSIQETKYKEALSNISPEADIKTLCDLVISSPEKLYFIPFGAVKDNSFFYYISDDKYDLVKTDKYIRSFLETECKVSAVKGFKDFEKFKKSINSMAKNESGKFDKRITELLLIYSL